MSLERWNNELIIALRNEKGSYNTATLKAVGTWIIALRNEKGSYNQLAKVYDKHKIIALRNEKGSYNNTIILEAMS